VRKRLTTFAAAMCLAVAAAPAPVLAASGPNLATGKTASVSSVSDVYVATNLNDGNQASYWESANNAFPQWAQIDLGSATSIDQIKLKLPTGWGARTETLSVQGSNDGSAFTTIVASAGYTFDPASSNTVTINFTATSTRYVRLNFTANTGWPAGQVAEFEIYAASGGTTSPNLALGKTMGESSHNQNYVAANANDSNQGTYWESANNAFPQWVQVDLGSSVNVTKLILKTPLSGWGARTQTIEVQTSTTGSSFTRLLAPAAYAFDPASGSAVTITFAATTTRYIRLVFTTNSAWPAGQLAEFEVYGPTTGDTQAPSVPGSLAYTEPQAGQIRLAWNASTDNVGVTGYDIYLNGSLLTSVNGSTLSYIDTQPATATVTYFVRAHDAAGNQSGNSNSVTRTGTPTGDTTPPSAPTNLAYALPQSGQIRLTWSAANDNVGVTAYDVYANGSLRASTNGSTLTYTDAQPDTVTVTYYVVARDAAGNTSPQSNTVTRTGSGSGGTNLAAGKPIDASSTVFTFIAANANDNDVTTYWEGAGGAYPSTLTVHLGANAVVNQVTVKLNPDGAWGARTQTFEVLGREQSSSSFTTIKASAAYTFAPASGNLVNITGLSASVADVQLKFTANTGAPNGQVAELQVIGTPAPNPDLTVTALSWTPASPIETDAVTLSATVRNAGTAASPASSLNFSLGATVAGTASVPALAVNATANVTANIGAQTAGSYAASAKVDEANTVFELNEGNNSFASPANLVVAPVQTSDLLPAAVSWSPGNPAAGNAVSFSASIRNQGTVASASGAHGITVVLKDATSGATIQTFSGSFTGTIAAGATTPPVNLGTWTAVNGKYTVTTTVAVDANELTVKQGNNSSTQPFFVGRGANMPYDMYEAEAGTLGGGAQVVGPNRTIGDLAGEASGRKAVTLNSTGSYVQWTTRAATNTLVTRFSIPDSSGGTGTSATLSIYVDGTFQKKITLNSRYEWLYGAEASPNNSPGSGAPRHIYDEANIMLNASVPAGHTIRLQKDSDDSSQYAIDFINLEQVAPLANPDPAHYVVPNGFTQQDVQTALDKVRMDTTGTWTGVYLPAGTYEVSNKLTVYLKPVQVAGAGVWYTRFQTPPGQENTDAGFDVQSSSVGTSFKHLAFFGNYTSRIDGPGKVWGELKNVSNLTIDDVWVEHTVCMFWGVHDSNVSISNARIRDTFADGINMTSESTNNHIFNSDARSNGDDAFAEFSAIDGGGSTGNHGNVFENLTATLTWRAAGLAVYGGQDNIFRNLYIADMLTYSGITISSLDFGYPFVGFGSTPVTQFQNISLVRAGGHFWGNQTFGAIWAFAASKEFRGIRVSDVDIVDPTYSGIMFQSKYPEAQPVTDTIFTRISISGAQRSGDAFDAKSGFGIWVNELPEAGQGPAVGSATFNGLTFSNNFQNIKNTTTTFTLNIS
jgi:hypothetical protein